MQKYPAAPHPFVLEPPGPGGTVLPAGSPFPLGLTLVGRALRYLPHFVFAFERLGQVGLGSHRVRCAVSTVEGRLDGQRWVLYSSEDRTLRTPDPFEESVSLNLLMPTGEHGWDIRGQLTLEVLTPLRIMFEERLSPDLPFHVLVRSLLRRLAHLSYFHCDGDPEGVPFRDWITRAESVRIAQQSLQWRDWERYSSRQRTTMTLGGLTGTIIYEGSLGPFLPILRLGEVTHVGKGTSFGLGHYRLVAAGSRDGHAA